MPEVKRRKVGPADPKTVAAKIEEHISGAKKEAAARKRTKAEQAAADAKKPKPKKSKEPRRGPKGKTISEIVDGAVRGAKTSHLDY